LSPGTAIRFEQRRRARDSDTLSRLADLQTDVDPLPRIDHQLKRVSDGGLKSWRGYTDDITSYVLIHEFIIAACVCGSLEPNPFRHIVESDRCLRNRAAARVAHGTEDRPRFELSEE